MTGMISGSSVMDNVRMAVCSPVLSIPLAEFHVYCLPVSVHMQHWSWEVLIERTFLVLDKLVRALNLSTYKVVCYWQILDFFSTNVPRNA